MNLWLTRFAYTPTETMGRLGYKHRARWMQALIACNQARGELYKASAGKAVVCGEAVAHWYNDDIGILRMYDEELGRAAVPLYRLGQGEPGPLDGFYGLGDGQGLALGTMSDGQLVGYWIRETHDRFGNPQENWLMLQGSDPAQLPVYEVSGGMMGVKADYKIAQVDTAAFDGRVFSCSLSGERTTIQLA